MLYLIYMLNEFLFIVTYRKDMPFYIKNTGQHGAIAGHDINIMPAWNKSYYGNNIKLGIYATGCNAIHNGLKDKIIKPCAYNFVDNSSICLNEDGNYSTELAALIGNDENASCVPGIAPKSLIYCYNLFENSNRYISKELYIRALRRADDDLDIKLFPINVHSDKGARVNQYNINEDKMIQNSIFSGRRGKGIIALFSSTINRGKNTDPNFVAISQTRFAFNIAATTIRGQRAYYSALSANYLVNVPSSDSETEFFDNTAINTFKSVDFSDGFKCRENFSYRGPGANAIAGGGIAVILGRTPKLTWRGLQLVLLLSAQINDIDDESWKINGAGIYYSNKYGFGRLDIDRAIEISDLFIEMPEESKLASNKTFHHVQIPSCQMDALVIEHEINQNLEFLESTNIIITTNQKNIGDLTIQLESPAGTKILIMHPSETKESETEGDASYLFSTKAFIGERTVGIWKLFIHANGCVIAGGITVSELTFYGIKKFDGNSNLLQNIKDIINQKKHENSKFPPIPPLHTNLSLNVETTDPYENEFKININSTDKIIKNPGVLQITQPNSHLLIEIDKAQDATKFNNSIYSMNNIFIDNAEFYFAIQIIKDNEVISAVSKVFKFKLSPWVPIQYRVMRPGITSIGYSLDTKNKKAPSKIFVTLTDHKLNKTITRFRDVNTGMIDIDIPNNIEDGIITVEPLTVINYDQCAMFILAFTTTKKYHKFYFNTTGCQKIPGLQYKDADPPIINTHYFTPSHIFTPWPTKQNDIDSKINIKLIGGIVGSMCGLVVIGVVIATIAMKTKKDAVTNLERVWSSDGSFEYNSEKI